MGGDPRNDTEIETIASGDRVEATAVADAATAPDVSALSEVSPERYRVEGEFARGGMGRILLARDRRLGRRIALKELHAEAGPGAPRRFVREAFVTARLQHPACGAGRPEAAGAGQTVAGTVLGTPHYMPPEQARGLPVDERADVYALGAMLYFLLTGAPPHAGKSAAEALVAATEGSVEPAQRREPEAPPDLVAIVGKAMAPSPAERYPSARELAADLRRFQTGQLVSAYRYSTRELLRRFVRRHRAAVIVASALTAALVVAVATGFVAVRRQARIAEAERDRARLAARKAEETNAFVVGMLKSADPRVAGRDVTVASVLDAASGRVEEELAGQPDVKAEVLTTLGTTYQGLGLYEPAKERLRAALDASRGAVGPEHIEVALALGRLAGAFEDEGDLRQAERLGREALARCTRSPTCCGPRATTRERRASGVTSSRSAVACFRTRTRWSPAPCRSWA